VALVKARKKLKAEFFEDFFSLLVEQFYKLAPVKRFKGFRLWACDGSAVKLPDNLHTRFIGTHTNQYGPVASVKLLCYFDLLNKIISRFWIKNKRIQEIRLVAPHLKDIPADVLSIYDRHYGSQLNRPFTVCVPASALRLALSGAHENPFHCPSDPLLP
jgi:hypothetical protein